MPRPALRSRSLRRTYVRVPGGATRIHYDRLRHVRARCCVCGKELNGVPWDTRTFRNSARSKKRPERMYGGYACHSCLHTLIKLSARLLSST